MERQRKIPTRYSALFKSFCVSMTTPLRIFEVLIGQHAGLRVLGRLFLYFLEPPVYLMRALCKGERHSADVTYFLFTGWSVSAAQHLQELLLISPFVSAPAKIKARTATSGSSFMKTFNKETNVCALHLMSFTSAFKKPY